MQVCPSTKIISSCSSNAGHLSLIIVMFPEWTLQQQMAPVSSSCPATNPCPWKWRQRQEIWNEAVLQTNLRNINSLSILSHSHLYRMNSSLAHSWHRESSWYQCTNKQWRKLSHFLFLSFLIAVCLSVHLCLSLITIWQRWSTSRVR